MVLIASKAEESAGLGPYWRGLGVWIILLAGYIAIIVGLHTETAMRSTAPPWYSWLRIPLTRTPLQCVFLVFPPVVFAGWVAVLRRMFRGPVRLLPIIGLGFGAVLLMNVTVAMMDGTVDAIWKPFSGPSEFFGDVPAVHGVRAFLRGYVENLYQYSLHTRTHPPGAVMMLYFVGQSLGPGIRIAAWTCVVTTATGVAPFFLLARRLVGNRTACLGTALYALAPSLVLFGATSMDGVFLVPLLWSMYFLQRGIADGGIRFSIAAGIALTASLMFSYVTVCVGAMMLIYAALEWRENPKLLGGIIGLFAICATVVGGSLLTLHVATGFDYLACFERSRFYDHYAMQTFSMSLGRYLDISFSNLIAFLTGLGFPIIVLWMRETARSMSERTAVGRFNLAAVISVLIFSFAHLFTHETERVWLFFVPPALIAAAHWIARQTKLEKRLLDWAMGLLLVQTMLFQWLLFTIW